MANTFKFGTDGNWAVKKDSVLAYNDENNNFKPLPFDFTRDTIGTYVDSDGLIKTAANNEARIDYLDNANGHLLLEPSRRNLNDYSEDGTQWDVINTTVSLDNSINKPDGVLGAYKQTDDATDAQHRVSVRGTVVNGTEYTFSAFVKKPSGSDIDFIYLLFATTFSTTRFYFNIEEGTSLDDGGTIENYGNGWYRVSATATANSDGNGTFGVNLTNANNNNAYSGTGNGAMYVYGIQIEDGGSGVDATYATSYIPTNGSSVTRAADLTIGTVTSNVIGQSEGVLYFEGSYFDTSEQGYIELSDGGNSNRIIVWNVTSTSLRAFLEVGNVTQAFINGGSISSNTIFKFAFKYKTNDFALWVNGLKYVDTNGSTFGNNVLNQLDLQISGVEFKGEVKEIKLYNTALTDAELETLTQV